MEELFKYCDYMDDEMDNQFKFELTYENLKSDKLECLELLNTFLPLFANFIKDPIALSKFEKFEVDPYVNLFINIHLKRQLLMIHHKTNLKLEGDNDESREFLTEVVAIPDIHTFVESLKTEFKLDKVTQEAADLSSHVLEKEKELLNMDHIPSVTALCNVFKNIIKYVKCMINDLNSFFKENNKESIDEIIYIDMFHHLLKLQVISVNVTAAYQITSDDLFNLPENSETWVRIKKLTTVIVRIY